MSCLLTTQQRSGPESAVTRFNKTNPFPLSYATCCDQKNLETFATKKIAEFGGIRRAPTLGNEIAENFKRLERGLWPTVMNKSSTTKRHRSQES